MSDILNFDPKVLMAKVAQAAGYTYFPDGYDEHLTDPCIDVDGFPVTWMPLEDDGQAFRLAGLLNMRLEFKDLFANAFAHMDGNNIEVDILYSDCQDDKQSAMRLAILLLAQEMWDARQTYIESIK